MHAIHHPTPSGRGAGSAGRFSLAAASLAVVVSAAAVGADEPVSLWSREGEDWPALLGPRGDGRSRLSGAAIPWPEAGPPVVWTTDLGEGYCGPVAALGRLLVYDRIDDTCRLRCLHAETGRELWRSSDPTDYADQFGYDGGPRASPLVAQLRVLTYGPDGLLSCRRLADGARLWQRDTVADYHVVPNFFGVGASPVVVEAAGRTLVVVQVGGSPPESRPVAPDRLDTVRGLDSGLVAFDLESGREVWRASAELASYAAPLVAAPLGRPRLLAWMRERLVAVEPESGLVTGEFRWRAEKLFSVNAASPVLVGERLLLSECYGPGSVLLEIRADGPRGERFEPVWQSPRRARPTSTLLAHWATPLVVDGHLYGTSGRNAGDARLVCLAAESGQPAWHHRGLGRASMTFLDGHLLVVGEFGELELVAARPDRYEAVSRATLVDGEGLPLLEPPCWAAPVVAHGYAFLRGKGRLVCIDLLE